MTRGANLGGSSTLSRLAALAAAGALSCASAADLDASGEEVGASALPIIGGELSDASQDAIVLLIHYVEETDRFSVCSGTLLTPRLVVTARHCLVKADPSMACAANGRAVSGGQVREAFDASELYVYAGDRRPSLREILPLSVRGLDILDEGGSGLCNSDIGLLLLEDDVPNAKIAPVRLDGKARVGERVTFVGWGTTQGTTLPLARQQRPGGSILSVGPQRHLGLGSAEIMVGEGTCEGDSGSPALSAKGAVIGALSRGGNGTLADDGSSCLDGKNIYTTTAGFRSLVMKGYARAGQDPWLEGRPNPRLARTGDACEWGSDCQSNACDPDLGVCEEDCSFSGCFEGFVCGPDGRQCVPEPPEPPPEGGCVAAGRPATTELAVAGLVAFGLGLRRRARRAAGRA